MVLAVATVTRLTWLVSRDAITIPFRDWLDERPGKFWQWLADLVACPFCISLWIGAAVAVYVWNVDGWALWIPLLTFSASLGGALTALAMDSLTADR